MNNSNTKTFLDELKFVLEEKGWVVEPCSFGADSESGWELSKYSPAGEDFSFCVCHNNDFEQAVEKIKDYAREFDVDEHIEMWIEARQNGFSGVPDTKTLVDDAEAIQEMLKELAGDVLTWQANACARCSSLDDVIKTCESVRDAEAKGVSERCVDKGER